ncbi:MAG: hypothetical protein K2W96_26715 [Gemmataceae bacterium]|nr:hypothetical protein [Gemmataceae bacterium]
MVKSAFKTFLGLALVVVAIGVARAEEDKKPEKKVVTLKGELGCPMCVFKVEGEKKCANAIKVKDGDKEVVYIFIDKGGKESFHKEICMESKKGEVKGVVSKKDDKLYITPEKDSVKFD